MSKVFLSYRRNNLYPTARLFKEMLEQQNDWVIWVSKAHLGADNDRDVESYDQDISEITLEADELETTEISTLKMLRSCVMLVIFASEEDVSSDWKTTWKIAYEKRIPIIFLTTGKVENLQDIPYDRHFDLDKSIYEAINGITRYINWIQSKQLKHLQKAMKKESSKILQNETSNPILGIKSRLLRSLRRRSNFVDLKLLAKASNSDIELIEEIITGYFPISEIDLDLLLKLSIEMMRLSPIKPLTYTTNPISHEQLSLFDFTVDEDLKQGGESEVN